MPVAFHVILDLQFFLPQVVGGRSPLLIRKISVSGGLVVIVAMAFFQKRMQMTSLKETILFKAFSKRMSKRCLTVLSPQ